MKRMLSALTITLSSVLLLGGQASAAHFLKVNISDPATPTSSKTFTIQYTALSTDPSDDITVRLLQNGSEIASETTTATYGDSGDFPVTVSSDGIYEYQLVAESSLHGSQTSETRSIMVDTAAPQSPIYKGVVRNGNTYTLTFTNPSDSEVKIQIFSSKDKQFIADTKTLVGTLTLGPNETGSFSYTAPDSEPRFNAAQAVDGAGNVSPLVGDSEVVATPAAPGGFGDGTAVADDGNVLAEDTDEDENLGPADEGSQADQEDVGTSGNGNRTWLYLALIAAVVAAVYYWRSYQQRRGGSLSNAATSSSTAKKPATTRPKTSKTKTTKKK